ncbi:MAG: hypothetical protein JWQ19_2103 [Subtercola sp.]|nr:hypothetical protein [Subtercola sp.]
MKKIVKGAIAAAAGIALLLGGAGTFAYWNSSQTISGASIVSGNLLVTDPGPAGVWTINGGSTPISLTGYLIVPGDVLTYKKTMAITATGNNLVATLGLGAAAITASDLAKPADVALAGYLTSTAVLTATGTGITGTSPTYTVTPGSAGISQNVDVVVTITFPKSTTAGLENNTKVGSVSLANLTVTLSQV